MKRGRAILVVALVICLGFLALRDGLEPIHERWAIGHSPFSRTEKSLYRVGKYPFFSRTRVDRHIDQLRFYGPNCVLYTTTLKGWTRTTYAVCGDRSPIMFSNLDFTMNAFGVESRSRPDTVAGQLIIQGARIPIGKITAAAKKARPFDRLFGFRFTLGWGVIPATNFRFPDQSEAINERGTTILHDAVANQDFGLVLAYLSSGIYPDLRDKNELTPLMVATVENNLQSAAIVSALLNAGADPDAQTNNGVTPLMFSVRAGSTLAAALLRKAGADTSLRTAKGQTAGELKPVNP